MNLVYKNLNKAWLIPFCMSEGEMEYLLPFQWKFSKCKSDGVPMGSILSPEFEKLFLVYSGNGGLTSFQSNPILIRRCCKSPSISNRLCVYFGLLFEVLHLTKNERMT